MWFQGSRETLLTRVLNRAQTSGRVDDTEGTFEKRYQGFLSESEEVIRYFEQERKLVKVIMRMIHRESRELWLIYTH